MKSKGIFSIPLLLLLAFAGNAQVTQRNILATAYSPEKVVVSIIPKDKWKPYPLTPQQWKDAVSDSMLKGIVDGASSIIDYKFEPISGSVSMDFKRTGDRLRHSGISFKKRAVQQYTIDNHLAPNPPLYGQEFDDSFLKIFKHCIDVHIGSFDKEMDYDFWAVIFEDKDNKPLNRVDLLENEIKNHLNTTEQFVKISVDCIKTEPVPPKVTF